MCRVLILDDNKRYAESLKRTIDGFDFEDSVSANFATTLDEALHLTRLAIQDGKPYSVFLIDQRLGAEKDGIGAMNELKGVSPHTSAIIFTGFGNTEVGIRAYRAGAFRYLHKPVEPDELEFVLDSLMRSRRESVENKWRNIFSKMMETALRHSDFFDIVDIIVKHSISLGFRRSYLFWAPKQVEIGERNKLVNLKCVKR
jgi:DNA-binding NtrC family response regulator